MGFRGFRGLGVQVLGLRVCGCLGMAFTGMGSLIKLVKAIVFLRFTFRPVRMPGSQKALYPSMRESEALGEWVLRFNVDP